MGPVYGGALGPPAGLLPGAAAEPAAEEAAGEARGAPCVVVVGSASRDLDATDPRGWRLGGGVSYGALTLARLGVRTAALIGVDAEAATAWELGLLRDAGVDLVPVRLAGGPVFDNRETPDGRVQWCHQPGQPIPVGFIPPGWRRAPAWLLAPVADELPDGWAAIPAGAVVALGWQGLLRELAAGERVRARPPAPRPLVHRADLVSLSVHDVGGHPVLADVLAPLRPGALCTLTRGPNGGLAIIVRRDRPRPRLRRYRAFPAVEVDAVGAGDVFLAGLLAARVIPALAGQVPRLGMALQFAAAAAAVHVTRRGLSGVPTLAEVRRRLASPWTADAGGGAGDRRPAAAGDPPEAPGGAGRPSPEGGEPLSPPGGA
ncbi:MAG: PfkB domain protein [Chloroflexi bacterium]|nr:PfkB domain protein [Chloroflexota bacterium]